MNASLHINAELTSLMGGWLGMRDVRVVKPQLPSVSKKTARYQASYRHLIIPSPGRARVPR